MEKYFKHFVAILIFVLLSILMMVILAYVTERNHHEPPYVFRVMLYVIAVLISGYAYSKLNLATKPKNAGTPLPKDGKFSLSDNDRKNFIKVLSGIDMTAPGIKKVIVDYATKDENEFTVWLIVRSGASPDPKIIEKALYRLYYPQIKFHFVVMNEDAVDETGKMKSGTVVFSA